MDLKSWSALRCNSTLVIPLECLLLEGTWDDNLVGVMNDGVSLDDAVFVLVGHRVFLGLKLVVPCLLFGDKLVRDWEVGVFLVEACVDEKNLIAESGFLIIGRRLRVWAIMFVLPGR